MEEEEEINVIKVVEYIDEACWEAAGHSNDDEDEITVSEEKILWVRGRSFKISPHEVGIGEQLKEVVIESICAGCHDHHFGKLEEDPLKNEQQQHEQQQQLDSSSRQLQMRLEAKRAKESTDNTKQQQQQSSSVTRIQKEFETQQKPEIYDTTKEEPVQEEMSMKDEEVKVHHSMLSQSMSTLSSSHDESETLQEELSSLKDDDQLKSAKEDIKHLKGQLSTVEESKTASNQQEESGTRSGYDEDELAVLKAKLSDSIKELRTIRETMLLKDEELKAAQEDNTLLKDRVEELLMINTAAANHQQVSDIVVAAGNHSKEELVEVLKQAKKHSDSKEEEELRTKREAMSWKDKELREAREEIKHLKDQLVVAQESNTTTTTNQQQSTGIVLGNTTKEELELLKAELSESKKELGDAKEALAKAQEEVKHLKDQLVVEQESNTISSNQQQSGMPGNMAKEELELLKAELEALKAELTDTKKDLRDAKEALAKAAANPTISDTILTEDRSITEDGRVGNPPQQEKEMEQKQLEGMRVEEHAMVAKHQKKQSSSRQLQGGAAAPSTRGPQKPSWAPGKMELRAIGDSTSSRQLQVRLQAKKTRQQSATVAANQQKKQSSSRQLWQAVPPPPPGSSSPSSKSPAWASGKMKLKSTAKGVSVKSGKDIHYRAFKPKCFEDMTPADREKALRKHAKQQARKATTSSSLKNAVEASKKQRQTGGVVGSNKVSSLKAALGASQQNQRQQPQLQEK